jgi:hypothetical protein
MKHDKRSGRHYFGKICWKRRQRPELQRAVVACRQQATACTGE